MLRSCCSLLAVLMLSVVTPFFLWTTMGSKHAAWLDPYVRMFLLFLVFLEIDFVVTTLKHASGLDEEEHDHEALFSWYTAAHEVSLVKMAVSLPVFIGSLALTESVALNKACSSLFSVKSYLAVTLITPVITSSIQHRNDNEELITSAIHLLPDLFGWLWYCFNILGPFLHPYELLRPLLVLEFMDKFNILAVALVFLLKKSGLK